MNQNMGVRYSSEREITLSEAPKKSMRSRTRSFPHKVRGRAIKREIRSPVKRTGEGFSPAPTLWATRTLVPV